MFTTYVLVIMMWKILAEGGVALTTQEFDAHGSCEAAATLIHQAKGMGYALATVCVAKYQEER